MLMFESHQRAGTVREYRRPRSHAGSPARGGRLEPLPSAWMLLRSLGRPGVEGMEHPLLSPGLGARDRGAGGGWLGAPPVPCWMPPLPRSVQPRR